MLWCWLIYYAILNFSVHHTIIIWHVQHMHIKTWLLVKIMHLCIKCHWLFMCSIIFRMIKSCRLTSLKRIRMIGVTWIWIELEPNMATLKFNYFLWITKSSNSELQYKSDAWNIWIRQDIIWHIHVVYFFFLLFSLISFYSFVALTDWGGSFDV